MNKNINNMGLQQAISLLSDEILHERLIIFLGAGCPMGAGLPSWDKMINDLIDKYNIKTGEVSLLSKAKRIEDKIGALELREEIADILRANPEVTTELYKRLISLEVNLFITTNYDHVLENSFRMGNCDPRVILNDEDIPSISPAQKTIVKLHGDIQSPISLVLSNDDYNRYNHDHKAMSEWFRSKFMDYTILFIGTSFDDPRLKEADEHIFSLFNKNRRPPFIFLKRPSSQETNYEVALEDFNAVCNDFKNKGIHVIIIDNYDEIITAMADLNKETFKKRLKDNKNSTGIELSLQKIYTDELEQKYKRLIDKETLELCDSVRGNGILPQEEEIVKRRNKLVEHLSAIQGELAENSRLEALLTLADAFLHSYESAEIKIAQKYFNEANSIFVNAKDKTPWVERIGRLQAKLLFFEGNIEKAITLIQDSKDEKTISTWLSLLIDMSEFDQAYSFVKENTPKGYWVPEAIYVLNLCGHLSEAEKLYASIKDNSDGIKSPILVRSIYAMVESLIRYALKRAVKAGQTRVYIDQIDDVGLALCRRALVYIDKLSERNQLNVANSYFAVQVKYYKLQILNFLKDFEEADKVARELTSLSPIKEELIDYIAPRTRISGNSFDADFIRQLIVLLNKKYSSKYWALLGAAYFQVSVLKENENAWLNIEKAAQLAFKGTAINLSERHDLVEHIFDTAITIGNNEKVEEARSFIENLLPGKDDPWRRFMDARYLLWKKEFEESKNLLLDIIKETNNIESKLKVNCHYFLSVIYRQLGDIGEAQKLLTEADQIYPNINVQLGLLSIASVQKEYPLAMKIVEKLEAIGFKDDIDILRMKASAAFNLREYGKAKETWLALIKIAGNKAEYSLGLAQAYLKLENYKNALDALDDYIKDDNKFSPECLKLAVYINIAAGDEEKAFEILDQVQEKILAADNYELIGTHVNLGFKTGNEERIKNTFGKLILLQQQGKLPAGLFERKNIDDVVSFMKERKERWEELNKKYISGQMPRYSLSVFKNRPLYLDWAVRTQKLVNFKPGRDARAEYSTYITNSFSIQTTNQGPDLVKIMAPPDITEVVVDYPALITLHRLGLLQQLKQRYKKVFYPEIIKQVWTADKNEYKFHQPSRERIYRNIVKRMGEFQVISLPESEDRKADYEIAVSLYEKIPLIAVYIKNEELSEYSRSNLLRFKQVLIWLYSKGKLSESRYLEIKTKKVLNEEPALVSDEEAFKILDNETRFAFEKEALELMEEYGLISLFQEKGKKVVLGSAIADVYNKNIIEINFSLEVGSWQKDLEEQIKNFDNFIPVATKDKEIKHPEDIYTILMFEPLIYAEENGLYLLTDDRFSQMIRTSNLLNRQFGAEVFLADIFNKGIINLYKYSESFVNLCNWRYRFLLPDSRIIAYFLKEFRTAPLGKDIEDIIKYCEECMEDPGLFLGKEPTITGLPCGAKYWLALRDVWIKALINIWIDEEMFENDKRMITGSVFRRALPPLPKAINPEIGRRIYSIEDTAIIQTIYIGAIDIADKKKLLALHELLMLIFISFKVDNEKQILTIKHALEFTDKEVNVNDKNSRVAIAMRLLWTFYGVGLSKISPDPQLLPVLNRLGVINIKEEIDQIQTDVKLDTDKQSLYNEQNKDETEFVSRGPVYIYKTGGKSYEYILPHDTIRAETMGMRKSTLDYISSLPYVSSYTKGFIHKLTNDILSVNKVVWLPASGKVSNQLLSDFYYSSSLFEQAFKMRPFPADLVNEAWKGILNPKIETIIGDESNKDLPLLLQKPFELPQIRHKTIEFLKEKIAESNNEQEKFVTALDLYHEQVYFIPVSGILSPSNIITEIYDFTKITDKQYFDIIKDWTNSKREPFSFLIAVDMLLSRRSQAKDSEGVFCNREFYAYLDSLLQLLMADKVEDVEERKDMKIAFLRWKWRLTFSKYYMMYLEMKLKDKIQVERIIALSWWLAYKAESSIYNPRAGNPDESVILHLERDFNKIEQKFNSISFEYFFEQEGTDISLQKYRALYEQDILISAIANLLSPSEGSLVFKGLMNPSTCLDTTIRNTLIEKLKMDIFKGNGQMGEASTVLFFLWDKSLCETVPNMMENYYGNAIEYLGQDKVSYFKVAREITEPQFLKNYLDKFPEFLDNSKPEFISLGLSTLKVYLFTHKNIPEDISILRNIKSFVKKVSEFKEFPRQTSLSALSMILLNLISRHEYDLADVLVKQFSEIEWNKLPSEVIDAILPNLTAISLLGGNADLLLDPLLKYRSSKKVREALLSIRKWLEDIFNEVPAGRHENYRYVLNKLSDI